MKTKLLLIILPLLFSICGCASFTKANIQIAKNETDKFNGNRIIETKTCQLCFHNTDLGTKHNTLYLCLRKVNNLYSIPVNIGLAEVEKYVDGSGITFLLDNGESVVLNSSYTGIGAERDPLGGDTHFFNTTLMLSDSDVDILSSHKITDVRIKYLGGTTDMSVAEKRQDMLMTMFKVIEGQK